MPAAHRDVGRRGIAQAGLLVDWVETYVQLMGQDAAELLRLLRKIEAIDSLEPLADLAEKVLVVDSVGKLGLG